MYLYKSNNLLNIIYFVSNYKYKIGLHTSHIRLFVLGSQFDLPILAIHNAFRWGSIGKLLIENPLAVELLQPGTQQPGIFLEIESLQITL